MAIPVAMSLVIDPSNRRGNSLHWSSRAVRLIVVHKTTKILIKVARFANDSFD